MNGDKVYGFYIDVNTDITAVAEDVICEIREYAIPALAAIDTIDKYYELLKIKDRRTIYGSTFKHEWSLLALTILKDKKRVREVFEIYENKLRRNKSAFEYAHVRFENNKFQYENGKAAFDVFITNQIVRFDCYSLTYGELNKIIDIMLEYGGCTIQI
ncbi:MAG: hypothetical protein IJV29_06025 [Butyrivibrio sp.]|nr:hypothetical protein [Butyrivibrio sp.]